MNNNLTEEQLNLKYKLYSRMKGRYALIRNPYFCVLPAHTRVMIEYYMLDKDSFIVSDYNDHNRPFECKADELNLIDGEFSDWKIVKTGIRTERKDKYRDEFVIELINNKRDIYFSSALVSLLGINDGDFVGFAFDPDVKINYLYKADDKTGYAFDMKTQRVTSSNDWRQISNNWESSELVLNGKPIIDRENHPDSVFFSIDGVYKDSAVKKKRKEEVVLNDPWSVKQAEALRNDVPGLDRTTPGVHKQMINTYLIEATKSVAPEKQLKKGYSFSLNDDQPIK